MVDTSKYNVAAANFFAVPNITNTPFIVIRFASLVTGGE